MKFIKTFYRPLISEISANKIFFSTVKQSLISNTTEIKQAYRFYQQRMIVEAIEHFERSLTIFPLYLKQNEQYNSELEQVISALASCYVWRGQINKLVKLIQNTNAGAATLNISFGQKLEYIKNVLTIIDFSTSNLNSQNQIVKRNLKEIKNIYQGNETEIIKNVLSPPSTNSKNEEDLLNLIRGELKSTVALVLTSLLMPSNFCSNQNYNKICNNLLKNAQKSSQKNIIKALIILITNLLRNKQFLQAEGMIRYCLDRKKQNLSIGLLLSNQQYILLNLLLSVTYKGVDRMQQSKKIQQDNKGKLNLDVYLLQNYLIDSI